VRLEAIMEPTNGVHGSGPQKPTLNITQATKQYMYEANNLEYLDCVNSEAHVGHSHPQVVCKGQQQFGQLVTAQSFVSENLKKYVKSLVSSLPESLSVCFFTTSGPEANDLALRLARRYTGERNVVVVEDAHHGNIGVTLDISPKMYSKVPGYEPPDWVHVAPLPDQYRGEHHYSDEDASIKYAASVESLLEGMRSRGQGVAAFFAEPYFVSGGVHPPAPQYFTRVASAVRSHGGLVIADERQTGLGRTGDHMWGFQSFGVVPDIVTIGKSMANGYPMGAVVCSREVSEKLGGYFSTFGGNPAACAIGLSVLEVISNEKLVSSAKMVGRSLQSSLRKLVDKHPMLGDIRGSGLVWGIEVVTNKQENLPDSSLTTDIMYRLKGKQVLVSVTGRDSNVLLFTPPMCFTMENGRVFTKCLDEVLTELNDRVEEEKNGVVAQVGTSVIVKNTLGRKRVVEDDGGAEKRRKVEEEERRKEEDKRRVGQEERRRVQREEEERRRIVSEEEEKRRLTVAMRGDGYADMD